MNVKNAISTFHAVPGSLAALYARGRDLREGIIGILPSAYVHHAVLSMVLTVRRRLAAVDIKARPRRAGVM